LRTDLGIRHEGGEVIFPLRERPAQAPTEGRVLEAEFVERGPLTSGGYRSTVALPPDRRALLPRSFDVVGDVVLVRLPSELAGDAGTVGEALLGFVPGARVVGWDQGVHGPERLRRIVRIAGAGDFRTTHRENELRFAVDLERAYFSPRLAGEHRRFAESVRSRDRVLDLCCGVGPFALTTAQTGLPSRVTGVDLNPEAIALFSTNRSRVRADVPVEAVCAPLEEFLPRAAVSDRVVFNLPREGIKYLPQVFLTVAPGGALQYYEVTERAEQAGRWETLRALAPEPPAWSGPKPRSVHAYSPSSDLVAYVFERTG
jgi:tRNA (guanine37-N1)-methyltransferase